MANTIALRKTCSTILDEVYKLGSLTAVLDGDNAMVKEGANAGELLVPKMDMDGMADYSRTDGYEDGNVTLEYETKKCGYDRGRKFTVDAEDNEESAGIAFGMLGAEFVRTKVNPEIDAYRFSAYAQAGTVTEGALATGKDAVAALRAARTTIENSEATIEGCYLFINPTVKGLIDDLDTTASKKVMEDWAGIVKVPTARFFTKIALNKGGFACAEDGKALNFLIVPKAAVLQHMKHVVGKVITPDANQDADAWIFGYRAYGIAETLDNKKTAIVGHSVA